MAQSLTTPDLLTQPIAENGNKNVIPATSADPTDGYMAQSIGFPPVCSLRLNAGGKAPKRADINGVLNLLSKQTYFIQNGGFYTFRQDVSDAIGGYPLNAVLTYEKQDGSIGFVQSLIENNTYNFVSTPSYIDGVKWKKLYDGFADVDFDNISTSGKAESVSWGRDFTVVDSIVVEGSSFSVQGTYTLGFSDSKVKIGIFQIVLTVGAGNNGATGASVTTDVVTSATREVVATNNGFTARAYITIPFINVVSVGFPTYEGGLRTFRLRFIGYM